MQHASSDDRIAFVLSFALPGIGQLWKGHGSGLVWFTIAALLVAFWQLAAENLSIQWPVAQYGSYIATCVASACHAYRCRRIR